MILVSGSAGFIGSNFVLDWFALCDEPVVSLDALTYAGNMENLKSLRGDNRHVFVKGDINGEEVDRLKLVSPFFTGLDIIFLEGQGNVRFGAGHNLAFQQADSEFHLVLNPDVTLAVDALQQCLSFFAGHPECGLISPHSVNPAGERLYLCKRFPSLFVLALRGFAPESGKKYFNGLMSTYEMRDVIRDEVFWDPPVVSGCYMFFRTDVLKKLGGFDSRFFLYFEDSDLSLQAAGISRIAYVPTVSIIHRGGFAAKKGWLHIYMFIKSAYLFYQKYGWKFFYRVCLG
ncbi:MAG TPA: hypothetical protein VLH56_04640 [Dissulfurispiraceae bacterium]|nr:hypothetical protein [Dissulfurispiraceae bacterium]